MNDMTITEFEVFDEVQGTVYGLADSLGLIPSDADGALDDGVAGAILRLTDALVRLGERGYAITHVWQDDPTEPISLLR